MSGPMRIVHIITGLGTGGAETVLGRLVASMDRDRFRTEVVSLTGDGPAGEAIRAGGVPVRGLGVRSKIPNPLIFWTLLRWIRAFRPDVVQTWLYHADLLGGLAARALRVPVAWNIRSGLLRPEGIPLSTRCIVRICADLSHRLPRRIVSNSQNALRIHEGLGYDRDKFVLIPNGFDTALFRPDPEKRSRLRREWGISDDVLAVGHAARFHPQKDHGSFLAACGLLKERVPRFCCVLCGEGVTEDNAVLSASARDAGLGKDVRLLGPWKDMPGFMAALDVFVMSSYFGEAFPGVVGEAMACGVPCVVTDVGDAALLVGDTGTVVPPRDARALAGALEPLLEKRYRPSLLGLAARRRIEENYGLSSMVSRYESLYEEMGELKSKNVR